MRRLASLLCVGSALLTGLTGCPDEDLIVVQPRLEVTPERLDFGTVELGQQNVLTATLRNQDRVDVLIEEIRVEDDCDGCFLAVNPVDVVEATTIHELGIRFRAVRLEVATGTVTIFSNDPDEPAQVVFLRGDGTDTRRPDIEVIPEIVDFGFLPAGGVAVSSFVIRSAGTNDLLIDRIRVDPPDAPFRVTTSTPSPQMPGQLEPGAQVSVSLRAELPEATTGTVSARILIETNVLEEKNVLGEIGLVQVPLTGLANLPPVAVIGDDMTVEPFTRVTLDGSASFDQDDPPDDPLSYRWELVSKPGGSTTVMERSSQPIASFWADLTGVYEVQLVVIDRLGLESAPAKMVVEALPINVVRIELTWDHPDADLDLHLIRAGGMFCDCATDVHYRDCGRTPNWFPSTPGANPRLDIDDRSGFGPENINIDGHGEERFIPQGSYQIGVHYFSSNDQISTWPTNSTQATVRVFIYGLLAAELTREMTVDQELWIAGELRWPEQMVVPGEQVFLGAECGVF